jgi:hypothetical protein
MEPSKTCVVVPEAQLDVVVTVKDVELLADAAGVVRVILPLVAPAGTVAVHAKAVILTPKLKRQMTEKNCPLR